MNMSTKPHGPIRFLLLMAGAFLLLSWSVPALAGGGPSEESCAALGYLTVKCFDCSSGPTLYKGHVSLWAEYNSAADSCTTKSAFDQAKQDCQTNYGIKLENTCASVQYSVGGKTKAKRSKGPACSQWPPY